jgi:hypothetical protein
MSFIEKKNVKSWQKSNNRQDEETMIKSIICSYSRKVGIDKDFKGQLRWLPSEEAQIHGL